MSLSCWEKHEWDPALNFTPHHSLSVTTAATQSQLSHKQAMILGLIFTSLLQYGRCSHLSRSERARSPHFLDYDAPDRAALVARVSVEGEPEGLWVLPTVVSDRTAMPHSADRHNKTTSRPTQNTLRGSAPPRTAGPVGAAPLSASASGLVR